MFIIGILSYIATGILAGILGGMLGIGGSVIAVPCLVLLFHLFKFPQEHLMHMVVATSLSAMVFNTFAAGLAQQLRKNVDWKVIGNTFIGLIIGAIIGPKIALDLPSNFLKDLFGLFLCGIAPYFFIHSRKPQKERTPLPGFIPLVLIGTSIAIASTILGITGGLFMMILLSSFRVPIKEAVGTSSVTSFIVTLIGALAYLVFGLHDNGNSHLGFIYMPAFITIGITALIFAPLGVHLSHKIHSSILKKVFSIVLFTIGIYMIIQG